MPYWHWPFNQLSLHCSNVIYWNVIRCFASGRFNIVWCPNMKIYPYLIISRNYWSPVVFVIPYQCVCPENLHLESNTNQLSQYRLWSTIHVTCWRCKHIGTILMFKFSNFESICWTVGDNKLLCSKTLKDQWKSDYICES